MQGFAVHSRCELFFWFPFFANHKDDKINFPYRNRKKKHMLRAIFWKKDKQQALLAEVGSMKAGTVIYCKRIYHFTLMFFSTSCLLFKSSAKPSAVFSFMHGSVQWKTLFLFLRWWQIGKAFQMFSFSKSTFSTKMFFGIAFCFWLC